MVIENTPNGILKMNCLKDMKERMYCIYFYSRCDMGSDYIYNPLDLSEKIKIKETDEVPDDFIVKIPLMLMLDFAQSIHDISGDLGYKDKNESKTEGLLEATLKHLDDMRKIVFEEKK